jgi:hypothetical protein
MMGLQRGFVSPPVLSGTRDADQSMTNADPHDAERNDRGNDADG